MSGDTVNVEILIQRIGDEWTGWVEDAPEVRATAPSQEQLLELLRQQIEQSWNASSNRQSRNQDVPPANGAPRPAAGDDSAAPSTLPTPWQSPPTPLTPSSFNSSPSLPQTNFSSPSFSQPDLAGLDQASRLDSSQLPAAFDPNWRINHPVASRSQSEAPARAMPPITQGPTTRTIPKKSSQILVQEVRAGQAVNLGPPTERDKNDVAKIKWNGPLAQFQNRETTPQLPPGFEQKQSTSLTAPPRRPSFVEWLVQIFWRNRRAANRASLPTLDTTQEFVPRRVNPQQPNRPPALTAPDPVEVRSAHLRQ